MLILAMLLLGTILWCLSSQDKNEDEKRNAERADWYDKRFGRGEASES